MKLSPSPSEVDFAFRHVPRTPSGEYRYLPLNELPAGTEVFITTSDAAVPAEDDEEPREVNGLKEGDLIKVSAGSYKLVIGDVRNNVHFSDNTSGYACKSLYNALAAGSYYTANLDMTHDVATRINADEGGHATTYRLVTGVITKIEVPSIDLTLSFDPTDEAYMPADMRIYRKQRNKTTNSRGPS